MYNVISLFIYIIYYYLFSTKCYVEKPYKLTLYCGTLFIHVRIQYLVKYMIVCQITNVRMPLSEKEIFFHSGAPELIPGFQ